MTNKRRPPRPVPELTAEEEAYLSWISDSKRFTIEAALAMYSGQVRVRPPTPALQLQLAYDFAALLVRERGQQAVVQYLYNEIGQLLAAEIGAKKC